MGMQFAGPKQEIVSCLVVMTLCDDICIYDICDFLQSTISTRILGTWWGFDSRFSGPVSFLHMFSPCFRGKSGLEHVDFSKGFWMISPRPSLKFSKQQGKTPNEKPMGNVLLMVQKSEKNNHRRL